MGKYRLCESLLRIMKDRGLNQVELAKKSGIKQQLISSYLRESKVARVPSLKSLLRLADALGCSLDELTGHRVPEQDGGEAAETLNLSGDALELARLYDKLPAGDWCREAVQKLLVAKREEDKT